MTEQSPPKQSIRLTSFYDDYGCGSGRFARILESVGHEVRGVDISPVVINQSLWGHQLG